ncbi:MAG: hypothetical protein FJX18_04785 [Alphaproteobacteria bacterium]|nr:hypothetical protein [Alphaproteobacteria bacterium]
MHTDKIKEIQQVVSQALMKLQDLVSPDGKNQAELLSQVNLFLLSIMSTAADLVELAIPGGGASVYAEVEAGAKMRGIKSIAAAMQKGSPHYSISNIDPNDLPTAMNYIGQQLSITLTKAMHELPHPLRKVETQLRGIEALLANFLNQKFNNSHDVLNALCEHVHMALKDLSGNHPV